ncbi:MAG: FkbM family methyltransferase [Erythrobacter sp.]|jgi:FkbM family methyltransferase|nr:FkbM family methyltransferase [Erythrobacter sp.]
MARDFLVWRHLRVVRARAMRHFHRLAAHASAILTDSPRQRAARTVYGVPMAPNWNDRTYAYCHYGTYGTYLADLIHSIDRPFAFLDIGANQGLFSLIAGQNPHCAKIVALEPVPQTHARLTRNLALNGLKTRSAALKFGLSDENAVRTIALRRAHSGVATLESHLRAEEADVRLQRVWLRSVEALDAHLPAGLPIFVKIDVEGHEITVIEQLLGSRHKDRIIGIFYEHDERWCDGARLQGVFEEAGFSTARTYGRGKHFDALATPLAPVSAHHWLNKDEASDPLLVANAGVP